MLASSVPAVDAAPLMKRMTVSGTGGDPSLLPTGQFISPTSAPGSRFYPLATNIRPDTNADAAEAVSTALSPDGATLLVLTSGYNQNFKTVTGQDVTYPVLDPATGVPSALTTNKSEWVFLYDVRNDVPVKRQQISIPDTYSGIVWSPDGDRFYVSGGIDDRVLVYRSSSAGTARAAGSRTMHHTNTRHVNSTAGSSFVPDAPFILLGHNSNATAPFPKYDGGLLKPTKANAASGGKLATGGVVAGLAISRDGSQLFAANFENDSVSTIDTQTRKVRSEIPLFTPGTPRGEFPYWIAVKSAGEYGTPGLYDLAKARTRHTAGGTQPDGAPLKAYVSSQRDGQVVRIGASGNLKVIPVGDGPNKMVMSADERRLYVANGNSDSVSVIDTETDSVLATIPLSRPGDRLKGANPNSLALSVDQRFLFVTLGGENAVAMISLASLRVIGRIPTGWYPNSVSVSQDGKRLFIVNAKSNAGPNPSNGRTTAAGIARNPTFRNEYNWALEKAGLLVVPIPDRNELEYLTRTVDANNGFDNRRADPTMAFLRTKIKHVVYVIKENRTYDQVLGDLPGANGDPSLTVFPQNVTPNHHALAANFVTLDNFFDSGESSGVGWDWSTAAHVNEYAERAQSVLYGNSNFDGLTYDYEGTNRNINVSLPDVASPVSQLTERITSLLDPSHSSSILPGPKDIAATHGADDLSPAATGGYIWDTALRAGKTVRNYGDFIDLGYYTPGSPLSIPLTRAPFESKTLQSVVTKVALRDKTDIYFRGYDNAYPDIYRFEEWKREFDAYVKNGDLPSLSLVRLMHDHFGSFTRAAAGLNTPELQMADNDYALGLMIESISKSPYWADTAIFVIEDDSQDGPDHVDGHRSMAYVLSAYTKRRAEIRTTYNTVDMLRTIEDVLGVPYMQTNDANAHPMGDVFTGTANTEPYTAIIPGSLCAPPVAPDLVPECTGATNKTPAGASRLRTIRRPQLRNGAWWSAMTNGMDFSKPDAVDSAKFNAILREGITGQDPTDPFWTIGKL